MPCFWMNKTWKSVLWEMQFSKNIWGLGELYFEDCKVLNYLTFIYLCFMYVITAIGFSMNHVPHAQQHACQAYEHLLLVSRWITRLFIIRKHLQPHASFLNHHVSFCIHFRGGSRLSHGGSLIRTTTTQMGEKPEHHNEVFQLMSAWSTKGLATEQKENGRKMVNECIKKC